MKIAHTVRNKMIKIPDRLRSVVTTFAKCIPLGMPRCNCNTGFSAGRVATLENQFGSIFNCT